MSEIAIFRHYEPGSSFRVTMHTWSWFLSIQFEQIRKASIIAGPETEVVVDSLLHTALRHLERHDMNLVLVRIDLGLQGDVVPFMTFYRVRVAYRPTLVVLVAHEHRAIIVNFPRDAKNFH